MTIIDANVLLYAYNADAPQRGAAARPGAVIPQPGPRHAGILKLLVAKHRAIGPLVTDAVLAALAIEYGALLGSTVEVPIANEKASLRRRGMLSGASSNPAGYPPARNRNPHGHVVQDRQARPAFVGGISWHLARSASLKRSMRNTTKKKNETYVTLMLPNINNRLLLLSAC